MVVRDICAVCAWRKDCRKKFSVSGRDVHCPDFSRDINIEMEKEKHEEELKKDEKGE